MDKVLRNVIIFSGAVLLMAIIAIMIIYKPVSLNSNNNANTNNLAGSNTENDVSGSNTGITGEVQNVKLSVSGGTYILTPSVLKKDVPVRMTADLATLKGCSRDVVISSFSVRKYVKEGDNVITFTPTKTGTINIACSMNMYRGTFTVTDDGSTSAGINLQAASPGAEQSQTLSTTTPLNSDSNSKGCTMGANGGSCGCGASSGSCGCGG